MLSAVSEPLSGAVEITEVRNSSDRLHPLWNLMEGPEYGYDSNYQRKNGYWATTEAAESYFEEHTGPIVLRFDFRQAVEVKEMYIWNGNWGDGIRAASLSFIDADGSSVRGQTEVLILASGDDVPEDGPEAIVIARAPTVRYLELHIHSNYYDHSSDLHGGARVAVYEVAFRLATGKLPAVTTSLPTCSDSAISSHACEGQDIVFFDGTRHEECCMLCSKMKNCGAWTWNPDGQHRCHVKQACSGLIPNANAVSGSSTPFPTTTPSTTPTTTHTTTLTTTSLTPVPIPHKHPVKHEILFIMLAFGLLFIIMGVTSVVCFLRRRAKPDPTANKVFSNPSWQNLEEKQGLLSPQEELEGVYEPWEEDEAPPLYG